MWKQEHRIIISIAVTFSKKPTEKRIDLHWKHFCELETYSCKSSMNKAAIEKEFSIKIAN